MNSNTKLKTVISNYLYDRESFAPDDQEDYCKKIRDLTRDSLRLGIAKLLDTGNISYLIEEILEAGKLRVKLEKDVKAYPEFSRFTLLSNYLPMLASFCIDKSNVFQFESLSFQSKYEFEEDYQYGLFFYNTIKNNGIVDELAKEFLLTLEDLDESDTPRFSIINALISRDINELNNAIESFVNEQTEFFEEMSSSGTGDELAYMTERVVNIELWGWLKIAKINNMSPFLNYYSFPKILHSTL